MENRKLSTIFRLKQLGHNRFGFEKTLVKYGNVPQSITAALLLGFAGTALAYISPTVSF